MLHSLLMAAHAACALGAFALGLVAVWPPGTRVSGLFRLYLSALWLMVLFLILVVLVDWVGLDTTTRLVYSGLLVLATYVGWRGWRAAQELEQRRDEWRDAFPEDVGFTLIALFDGFVIVSSIDLGAPLWLVVALGVLGVVVGRLALQRLKEHATAPREFGSLTVT